MLCSRSGLQLRLNFELAVAAVSDTVEVSAAADMPLAQASPTIGGVLTVQKVADLPLTDRNVLNLSSTQAGVNGQSFDGNNALFTATKRDGVDINATRDTGVPIYTSVDLVEEVRVITAPADAEIARGLDKSNSQRDPERISFTAAGSGRYAIPLSMPIHGSINFNGTPCSILNRNQFGGRLGRAIVKNKTFFFLSLRRTAPGCHRHSDHGNADGDSPTGTFPFLSWCAEWKCQRKRTHG